MRISSITKNAGKACNNRLYRHIRTFEKIVKNYFVIYTKNGVTDFGYAVFYIPTERQLGKGVTYAMRDTGMLQSVRVCRGHRG